MRNKLQQEGFKVKFNKCAFSKKEVKYLGHVIYSDGVSTDPDKISAVANWIHQTSISELWSFLGFASYYRRFVEKFSKLATPLHHPLHFIMVDSGSTCWGMVGLKNANRLSRT